jgi:aerobic-type carbon monoxide dehydrogenase small subunit (CoxS/CutS family)
MAKHLIELTVNDQRHSRTVDSALNLVDFLRNEIGLKGTHIGCEHGVCGACTVLVNQKTVRGCLMLAVQADGQHVQTIESIANADGSLS